MTQVFEQESSLSSVATRVEEGERVRLKVGEREIAVISLEDLDFLEDVENKLDLLDALEALQEAAEDKRLIPWEELLEEVKQIGIDVFILLDVSASMKAEDLKPNRLEKAKNEIAMLIRKLQGDRIGLIIFAGDAYVQFPLTTDYSAANLFLSTVDVNSIPQQGTAIASAINLAAKSFDTKAATKKVMVIITDGEDHEGDIDSAVKDAANKEILVYTIGMGSPSGAPIPVYDSNNHQVGFKQDSNGSTVLTKLDEATLQQIASKGGGKYYLSSSYQNELDLIYKDLSSLEKSEYGSKRITDYDDKYFYFLIPAFLILIVELFLTERKSKFLMQILKRNV